ncbi:hypothetical protein O3G_MSEX005186 [Manduca sexta]|uniref:Sensory neuron membrane protein 2 n=1 Tax=Manduca sexta TaxID=7130 RepID=A0A921YZV6_MANSE|nr:hypothetical protein O3G_MSEX005186 [Manduca sexta]KAG6447789.1 hypothetical protein O3G_MSEX005186 [Manduca sexta]KAG6447790.1 hypothetical protein O3G_MSEX005186 [Manduca sexta]
MLAKHSKLFFTGSVVFLIVAIVLASWGFPKIISTRIQKSIQLENSSMMYDKWVKLPIPLIFKVYFFNVTNAEGINEGERPILQEIGPYVYKQYRERTVLGYGPNDTIKYMLKKNFVFDPEASNGLTEDDDVTVINFPYMAALLTIQQMMPSAVAMVNRALEQFFSNLTDPFMRVKVKDLLFDGVFLNCDGDSPALSLVCAKLKADSPPTMRPAEDGVNGYYFSMFSHLNRTETGPYEMVRGTEDVFALGNIVSYKEKKSVSAWGDEYCNRINGSDASIFPPIDENNVPERLYTFEPEICRSLYASLAGKATLFNISTYYYEISSSALASKSANPDNKCYCKKDWSASHDGCLLMGVFNLMPCQGAPAIASLPHFYLASEELLEYFEDGVKPDKEKHNTYVYIDPVTGVVLKGVKRLQFNIELRNMPRVPQLQAVPTGLFPMLWIEEGAVMTPDLQQELRDAHALLSYAQLARWIILAAAIILAIVATITVARSTSLISWPRNSNSVNFIIGPMVNDKMR